MRVFRSMESLSNALIDSIRFLAKDKRRVEIMDELIKKALWIPEELHKDIKIFAIQNSLTIEQATQMLIKLGMVTYEAEKGYDSV